MPAGSRKGSKVTLFTSLVEGEFFYILSLSVDFFVIKNNFFSYLLELYKVSVMYTNTLFLHIYIY